MSLEHQLPVLMKKTQMSGDRAQCGLTSLLPMSCRGRAEAFARRLHTRLRNLGGADRDDAGESRWLAAAAAAATAVPRDSDLFFDFELECESPSSPVDDCEPAFPDRSPSDDGDAPFYDVDSEPLDPHRPRRQDAPDASPPPLTNGFSFSSAFYTDRSPIKSQPAPRENGLADGRLYTAITFDDCARRDDVDETDCAPRLSPSPELERLPAADSDSEFESAKSEPIDVADEALEVTVARIPVADSSLDRISELSVCLDDIPAEVHNENDTPAENHNHVGDLIILEDEFVKEGEESKVKENGIVAHLEITAVEVSTEKEASPAPEQNPALLCAVKEEEEEEAVEAEERPQRVRRCSSLKTGKTPPGTPGRKKIVRFADVLGLDLADVKTFMDEIPVIPKSAYEDLANADLVLGSPPARAPGGPRPGALSLAPLFQPPRDVTEALEARCVCLEAARAADGAHLAVSGSVRVRNLDFHKTVHVRYSMDGWRTYTDLQATYVPSSCDGFSDRFQFLLYAPALSAGRRLELAVRFQCKGRQYWDNNFGVNYCFECLLLGAPPPPLGGPDAPLHPTRDWHPSFY